jgi:transposase
MRKEELFLLVKENQPKEKRFPIDQYLSALGHTVGRLPPYMCDLNATEKAWAKVKNYARDANTRGKLT